MPPKELLRQEIADLPDRWVLWLLEFVRRLKGRAIAKPDAMDESSGDLIHPFQGCQPYRYDDPFGPAVVPEDWDVLQ